MKLSLKDVKEFEAMFKTPNVKIANGIVKGIEESFDKKKKTAQLFEFNFDGDDYEYTVSLPSAQWASALKACLKQYESMEMFDEAIDTYQLIKKVSE